ncbi:MAG: hypothetical protein M3378_11250 [Actinomycetota bacterium]|nr:hypothetical protein [Actinomycetota bacterium]
MTILVTLEAVAILLLGLLVAGLLRSHAEMLRLLHRLGSGLDPDDERAGRPTAVSLRTSSSSAGHDVVGTTPDNEAVSIGVVGAERSTLLAFLSSGCLTCGAFWERLSTGSDLSVPGGARLVVVTKGRDEESESKLRQLAPRRVPLVMSSVAWAEYEVPVAPYFIYVDGPSGQVVGEGAAGTWEQVSLLLSQSLEDAGRTGDASEAERQERQARVRASDAAREARADQELTAAGIHPGHPTLHPQSSKPPPQGAE